VNDAGYKNHQVSHLKIKNYTYLFWGTQWKKILIQRAVSFNVFLGLDSFVKSLTKRAGVILMVSFNIIVSMGELRSR